MRCISIFEERYVVQTHWGSFQLDEGAYRDYLQNKLWISWKPHSMTSAVKEEAPVHGTSIPPNVSEEAIRLRDEGAKHDVFFFAQERFPTVHTSIPFKPRMNNISIDELSLSVRAYHCLMRSGAITFGALYDLITGEYGLRSVRNLGFKSEEEILHGFFIACYYLLSTGERAQFWQMLIDESPLGRRS